MYRRLIYLQGLCAKLESRYGAADQVVREIQRELEATQSAMREDQRRIGGVIAYPDQCQSPRLSASHTLA